MLFWISLSLLIICIVAHWLTIDDELESLFGLGAIISFFTSAMFVVVILVNYIGMDAKIERWDARHDSLVYQYENDIYENDNDLGKKELYSEIQTWNEWLVYRKEIQDNFWVGILYPNIYDQLEFIELK